MSHGEVALAKHQEIHIYDLPSEILVHIFLRLPVKSLIRAKCTCILWFTTISDPKFIELQFNRAVENPGHLYRFSGTDPNIYFVERESDDIVAMRIPFGDLSELYACYSRTWVTTGGLMAYMSKNEKFCYICNPIIREQIRVPMDPCFGGKLLIMWWGFGYSFSTKEYKIVLFGSPLPETNQILHGVIYTVGSESWREIPHVPFRPDWQEYVDCAGTLFWLIFHDGSNDVCRETIGSFDIGSEEFRGWQGPYSEMRQEMGWHEGNNPDDIRLGLIKMGDNVACVRRKHINYSIWTLRDKVNEAWIKVYEFMPSSTFTRRVRLIGLWMNRDLLAYSNRVRSVCSSRPRCRGIRCVTYDTNSGEFRDLLLPFGENSDGSATPREPAGLLSHVGCLISPSRIVPTVNKSNSSGNGSTS